MRENRTCGSEGGEGKPFPTPIRVVSSASTVSLGLGAGWIATLASLLRNDDGGRRYRRVWPWPRRYFTAGACLL